MGSKVWSVLVVEDEYFIAAELTQILQDQNFSVVGPVPTAEAATALIATDKPDCAVLDLNLRGELTFDLARALLGTGIPVVFVTGYDREHIPASFGDVPMLLKPFNANELVAVLNKLGGVRAHSK